VKGRRCDGGLWGQCARSVDAEETLTRGPFLLLLRACADPKNKQNRPNYLSQMTFMLW